MTHCTSSIVCMFVQESAAFIVVCICVCLSVRVSYRSECSERAHVLHRIWFGGIQHICTLVVVDFASYEVCLSNSIFDEKFRVLMISMYVSEYILKLATDPLNSTRWRNYVQNLNYIILSWPMTSFIGHVGLTHKINPFTIREQRDALVKFNLRLTLFTCFVLKLLCTDVCPSKVTLWHGLKRTYIVWSGSSPGDALSSIFVKNGVGTCDRYAGTLAQGRAH